MEDKRPNTKKNIARRYIKVCHVTPQYGMISMKSIEKVPMAAQ